MQHCTIIKQDNCCLSTLTNTQRAYILHKMSDYIQSMPTTQHNKRQYGWLLTLWAFRSPKYLTTKRPFPFHITYREASLIEGALQMFVDRTDYSDET